MSKPKVERSISIPLELLKDLLTASEWRMVKQRLYIIDLLSEGLSVRAIAQRAQVGTDTVVRIARKVESTPTLRKYLSAKTGGQSLSKWVFGQAKVEE